MNQNTAIGMLLAYLTSLDGNKIRRAIGGYVARRINETGDAGTFETVIAEIKAELDKMSSERGDLAKLVNFTLPNSPVWSEAGVSGCSVNVALRRLDGSIDKPTTARRKLLSAHKLNTPGIFVPEVVAETMANVA